MQDSACAVWRAAAESLELCSDWAVVPQLCWGMSYADVCLF